METAIEEDLVVVDYSDVSEAESQQPPPSSRANAVANDAVHLQSKCPAIKACDMKDAGPASSGRAAGKTPYTLTMELQRGPKGYGFSVTWTHPPR